MNSSPLEIKKESFTPRELEILGLIARGHTNQEISQKLYVSAETVKWYVKQIFPKLGVSNRTQAAIKADEAGILGQSDAKKDEKFHKLDNLPAQLTSYIGREKDISQIKKLISEYRLVTLTGAGGIGKTRLSLQVAKSIQNNYHDGVWLVELASLDDPSQVPGAIAKALAFGERDEISLDRALKNYLSTKNLLLVIDNFEHLLSAAPFIGELLADASKLSILATSRELLNVYGEIEYQVSPLELPDVQEIRSNEKLRSYDAVSLFVERAQATKPSYSIEEDQIQSIVKICKLLDGLPLAIELSASMVKLFPPTLIAEQLKETLDALPPGPRDLPLRQRSLQATLEWSYNLLTKDEKTLFTNMAVFTGGFTLEAIQAVCAGQREGKLINTVTALVNRNLLNTKEGRDGEIYFWMLETTRQLTREFLNASGNLDSIYRLHAEYYVRLSERASREYCSPMNKYWFMRIQIEQENIRDAFAWLVANNEFQKCLRLTIALKNFWRNYGFQKEGLRWFDLALHESEETTDVLRAKGYLVAADYCIDLYQKERAGYFLKNALEIFETAKDPLNIGWCKALMSIMMFPLENEISALDLGRESLEIFRQLNDMEGMIFGYNLLGELYRNMGNYDEAKTYYEQCLQLAQKSGDILREGTLYGNLGILAYQRGDFQDAETLTKLGLKIFLDMDAYYGIFYDIGGLAGAALGMEEPIRAVKLLGISSAGLDSLESSHQPVDQSVIRRIFNEAREILSEKEFKEAWEAGKRMTVQEAFEYALSG